MLMQTAAAMVALADLSYLDEQAVDLAREIAAWALENLRSPQGYFYYQRRVVGTRIGFPTCAGPKPGWHMGWRGCWN